LVEAFIKRYTIEGELVLDPFAGFGTTLFVAERMGRRSVGVEFHEDRARYIAGRIGASSRIVHGDSRRIDELGLPVADFCITSPPYMCRNDTEDPLQGYTVPGSGYDAYLEGLTDVFRRLRAVLKPQAVVVVNVSNIKRWDGLTTLAWDAGGAISKAMSFEGEVVVCWDDDDHTFGYDHEYCLVFTNG
jgi:DNA modification methylase